MIIMNKLIYDGILGIDLLNVLDAKINIKKNKIECNYKGTQYEINMNEDNEQSKVSETPVVLSKPPMQCVPTQNVSMTNDEISVQEEKLLHNLIEEYENHMKFNEAPTQTAVYEHSITVSDPTKFVRRTYPIPMRYEEEVETEIRRVGK